MNSKDSLSCLSSLMFYGGINNTYLMDYKIDKTLNVLVDALSAYLILNFLLSSRQCPPGNS